MLLGTMIILVLWYWGMCQACKQERTNTPLPPVFSDSFKNKEMLPMVQPPEPKKYLIEIIDQVGNSRTCVALTMPTMSLGTFIFSDEDGSVVRFFGNFIATKIKDG